MKKKLLLLLFVTLITLTLVGCGTTEQKEMTNPSFGKYNGIYKLNNCEFRVLHIDDNISYRIYIGNELRGNGSSSLEDNKLDSDDFKFEFKDSSLVLKSKVDDIPSGEYKKDSGYSTDEIYADYVGEVSLFDSNYNGKYENEKITIYSIQSQEDEVKVSYTTEEESVGMYLEKKDKDYFATDFFDKKYEVKYNDDTLSFTTISEDEKESTVDGEYTRKGKMTKEEAIKLFYQ